MRFINPRTAITAVFALNGYVFGSWAARVPDVSSQVDASPSELGFALLCVSLGALATMQLTGALCARIGSGMVGAGAAALTCMAVVLPGLATSVTGLAVALLAFGAATGMGNVAANSLGVQVEAGRARPLMPSMHAGFSFGGLAGALTGGLASAAGAVAPHLLAVGLVGIVVIAVMAPALVSADRAVTTIRLDPATAGASSPASRGVVIALGAIAGCTAYGEGSLADWGALHLRESLHATPFVAAAGYAGFSLAMALGRLGGGRLLSMLGDTRLLVGGGVLAAVGVLTSVLAPVVAVALVGFVMVGLGLANVFPVAIARAGSLGGPNGVALASTVGYSGLLGGPPAIGFLAESAGIPAALTTISMLAGVAALLAMLVHEDRSPLRAVPTRVVDLARDRPLTAMNGRGFAARRHAVDADILAAPSTPASHRVGAAGLQLLAV